MNLQHIFANSNEHKKIHAQGYSFIKLYGEQNNINDGTKHKMNLNTAE